MVARQIKPGCFSKFDDYCWKTLKFKIKKNGKEQKDNSLFDFFPPFFFPPRGLGLEMEGVCMHRKWVKHQGPKSLLNRKIVSHTVCE